MQMLSCESRQLDQHVRSSFPKPIESRRNSTFSHYSHSDIYGPSPISSFGFKYFLSMNFFHAIGCILRRMIKIINIPTILIQIITSCMSALWQGTNNLAINIPSWAIDRDETPCHWS